MGAEAWRIGQVRRSQSPVAKGAETSDNKIFAKPMTTKDRRQERTLG